MVRQISDNQMILPTHFTEQAEEISYTCCNEWYFVNPYSCNRCNCVPYIYVTRVNLSVTLFPCHEVETANGDHQRQPACISYVYKHWLWTFIYALQGRHNGRDDVWNHQPHDCLCNRLFRRRSKKTSKPRVTGNCEGNSPVTGDDVIMCSWKYWVESYIIQLQQVTSQYTITRDMRGLE